MPCGFGLPNYLGNVKRPSNGPARINARNEKNLKQIEKVYKQGQTGPHSSNMAQISDPVCACPTNVSYTNGVQRACHFCEIKASAGGSHRPPVVARRSCVLGSLPVRDPDLHKAILVDLLPGGKTPEAIRVVLGRNAFFFSGIPPS